MDKSLLALSSVLLGGFILVNINKVSTWLEKLLVWAVYRKKTNYRPIAASAYIHSMHIVNTDPKTVRIWDKIFESARAYREDGIEKHTLVIQMPSVDMLHDGDLHFDSIGTNVTAAMVEFLHYLYWKNMLASDSDDAGILRQSIAKAVTAEMSGYWYFIDTLERQLEQDSELFQPVLFFATTVSRVIKNDMPTLKVKIDTGAFIQDGFQYPAVWAE